MLPSSYFVDDSIVFKRDNPKYRLFSVCRSARSVFEDLVCCTFENIDLISGLRKERKKKGHLQVELQVFLES